VTWEIRTPPLGATTARGAGWWSILELTRVGAQPRLRPVVALWALALATSIAAGIANVVLGWNGLEMSILGMPFDVTAYPPFVISILLALWLGPAWAAIPIYLANLASAMASGLSFPMSALFALAGAVETLMLWATLVALRVDPDLRRARDLVWFLATGLVSAVTGSLAAILWNSSHGLDPIAGQRIWRGWVLGDFLQLLLLVVPLLYLLGPRVRGWFDRHFVTPPHHDFSYVHGVALTVAVFAILGVVVFLGVHQALRALEVAVEAQGSPAAQLLPRVREIILVMALLSTALILATGIFSTALARMGERQRRESLSDSLTGCFNRRAFAAIFQKEAERSRRLGLGIGLLFLDIDRFKELNDRRGHEAGDLLLERLARRIEGTLRETDALFRWGGEEFLVLLPHTGPAEVATIAERVREAVAHEPLVRLAGGPPISSTVSIGAASASRLPGDAAELVRAADQACYQAKREGRDRVVVAAA
jgi:diguanylate cyclase (GGDEF)-like protein